MKKCASSSGAWINFVNKGTKTTIINDILVKERKQMVDPVIIGNRAKIDYRWNVYCEYRDDKDQLGVVLVSTSENKDNAQFIMELLRKYQIEHMAENSGLDHVIDFFVDDEVVTKGTIVDDDFFVSRGIDPTPIKSAIYEREHEKSKEERDRVIKMANDLKLHGYKNEEIAKFLNIKESEVHKCLLGE